MNDRSDSSQNLPAEFRREWLLRRNLALSPAQLAACFAGLAAASVAVAVPFGWMGAWPVLSFAGLEIAALGIAFAVYALHAADGDRVVLDENSIRIETIRGGKTSVAEWSRLNFRVHVEHGRRTTVRVGSPHQSITLGDWVGEERRATFAQELTAALRQIATHVPAQAVEQR